MAGIGSTRGNMEPTEGIGPAGGARPAGDTDQAGGTGPPTRQQRRQQMRFGGIDPATNLPKLIPTLSTTESIPVVSREQFRRDENKRDTGGSRSDAISERDEISERGAMRRIMARRQRSDSSSASSSSSVSSSASPSTTSSSTAPKGTAADFAVKDTTIAGVFSGSNKSEVESEKDKDLFQIKQLVKGKRVVALRTFIQEKNWYPEKVLEYLYEVFKSLKKDKDYQAYQNLKEFLLIEYQPDTSKHLLNTEELPVFLGDGIKLTLTKLKEKRPLGFDCIVCEDMKALQDRINEFKKMGKEAPKNISFIVRPDVDSHHVTPIFLEKVVEGENIKYKCVIMDSNGSEGTVLGSLSVRMLTNNKDFILYCFKQRRQTDETSCPILAIRDIIEISKSPKDFMEIVESSSVKKDEEIREFTKLPIAMMKVTQSITTLENYLNLHYGDKDASFLSKTGPKSFKKEFTDREEGTRSRHISIVHSKTGGSKPGNVYTANKVKLYELMLIFELIYNQMREQKTKQFFPDKKAEEELYDPDPEE